MPLYNYKAKVKPDVFKTGLIEAENERAAAHKLMQSSYHPVSILPAREHPVKKHLIHKKIKSRELYIFMRQLANLIEAGLPLVRALGSIGAQHSNYYVREMGRDLGETIQKGKSFSEALAEFPGLFGPLEISMIKSSESSGTLHAAMAKMADIKEKEIDFAGKIKTALAYPLLLICAGLITLFVLMAFVLPRFIVLFKDLGQQLPLITQVLIGLSGFLQNFWPALAAGAALAAAAAAKFLKTAPGKLWLDSFLINLPVMRQIIVQSNTSRFALTLATLLENGVPVLDALSISGEIAGNRIFAREIRHMHTQVSRGQHISEVIRQSRLFDKNAVDLLSAGEESGRLEEMLYRVAKMNEAEVSRQIESFVLMLEPALIIVLGAIIGFIVMAILLPVFQMNFLVQ